MPDCAAGRRPVSRPLDPTPVQVSLHEHETRTRQGGDVVVVYSDATLFRGVFETGGLTGWSSHMP